MKLLIFGSGAHGRMVAETAAAGPLSPDIVFVDSNPEKRGLTIDGIDVVHISDISRETGRFVVALGNPNTRLAWADKLSGMGIQRARPLIHPTAYVSPRAFVGEGTVVLPHAIIENGARIDRDCLINSAAYVSHDAVLEPGASLGPHAKVAGRATVGRAAMLGMGAAVNGRLTVGEGCLVGMRAIVMRNLPANTLIFDMPSEDRGEVTDANWSRAF